MALKIDPWSFPDPELDPVEEGGRARIVLGGGCFWCTEAVYREVEGVLTVKSGLCRRHGGNGRLPHRLQWSHRPRRGDRGHLRSGPDHPRAYPQAVLFDRSRPDGEGPPGSRCRPGVPVGDLLRKRAAAPGRRGLHRARSTQAKLFDGPIQTTLEPLQAFYEAEDYHHDFAARNPNQPYIRVVAAPKVAKLRATHRDLLKAG